MPTRGFARVLTLLGASALLVALVFGAAKLAVAVWMESTPPGEARSSALSLPAGNIPSVTSPLATTSVNVSWPPATGGAPIAGYELRAFDASSGVARPLGGDCAGVLSGTSCTDVGVPTGTWTYSVAPRQELWRGPESPRSQAVTVDASYRALVLSDGPAGYWRLGESSGTTAFDETATSDGTYAGAATLGSPGALVNDPNTAVDFDGASGRVNIPSVPALAPADQVSIEAWVNTDSTVNFQWVVSKNADYFLYINEGIVVFGVNDGVGYPYAAAASGPPGVWQHYVGTYDGTTLSLYQNGVRVAQSPMTGTFLSTTAGLTIGAFDAASAVQTTDGRIDEVAVYGRALSAEEVVSHHERGVPVQTTFPVAGSGYADDSWAEGCDGKICGRASAERAIQSVTVSVRQGSGNYWAGTAFASPTEVWLPAAGTTSWTLPFPATNFLAEGPYTVRAVGTDASGTTFAASAPFTIDRTAPSVSVFAPFDTAAYNDEQWNSACNSSTCGLQSDTGTGVEWVALSLRQGTGNYWDGTSFSSATEVWLPTTVVPDYWYTAFPATNFPAEGSYTAVAVAADRAGNVAWTTATFLIDRTAPTPTITFPAATTYTGVSWDAGCSASICGTAADNSSGVAANALIIRQTRTGLFWDGASFSSATGVAISATGTTSWSVPFPASNFPATGSYDIWAYSGDAAGNVAVTFVTVTVDRTPPAVGIGFPAATASYTASAWDAGCASKICGTTTAGATPVTSVAVSIRQGSGNYWNGTAFASATEVMLPATGTGSWSLPFSQANFPTDGSYTVRVAATAADGLTGSASATFTIDRATPTVAISFPAAGGSYGVPTWNPGCSSTICGTAADTASGVASVKVSIRQGAGNYWNGTAFASATEVLFTATGTTSWTLPFPQTNFASAGAYTVRALATDKAGLTATTSNTFDIDYTRPSVTGVVLSNASGVVGVGDEVRITFSQVLDVSTICSGWSGTTDQSIGGSGVVVTFTNGGTTDTLSVTAAGCTVGTLAAGNYVSSTATFSGSTASTESRLMWTEATRTLTIHLGSRTSGSVNSGVAAGTVSYTPSTAMKDRAGNQINAGPFSFSSQRF